MKKYSKIIQDEYSQWHIEIDQPDHFRAVRRFTLAHASTDAKAFLAFGLLFLAGGTLFALIALTEFWDAATRIMQYGGHPAVVREGLVWLGVVLGWGVLLYLLWPKMRVLEARPGFLRFGRHTWTANQVARLEIHSINRRTTEIGQAEFLPSRTRTYKAIAIFVVEKNGRTRRAWAHNGKQKSRAAAWAQHMAQIAAVPVAAAKETS